MSLNDWNIDPDPETLDYHGRQWAQPYESTVSFAEFIKPWAQKSYHITDLGCGAGASTCFLAKTYYQAKFTGVDISKKLILSARFRKQPRTNFLVDDITHISQEVFADGVVSLQTFSWMPDIETPLKQICMKIRPNWMAFSSLFYGGDISADIVITEPKRPRKSYYNIYSIPRTQDFLKDRGYRLVGIRKFEMKQEIPAPINPNIMKTYTDRGFQISGPLMLPWYFLAFERIT